MTTNKIITIDVSQPIDAIVFDSDDTSVNNRMWKFCEDDPTSDKEPTYSLCGFGPDAIIPAGSRVRINHLYGFYKDGGLTEPTDYVIDIPVNAPVHYVMHVLYSRYYTEMQKESAYTRDFLFIETVHKIEENCYLIQWGT